MKKTQLLTALLLSATVISAALPTTSFATEDATDEGRGEKRVERVEQRIEKVEERVEDKVEKTRERVEEATTALRERRSKIIEAHSERLQNRFIDKYYVHLSNFIVRIQKRLDTMKTNGKDVTAAQAKLDLAKSELESAKIKSQSSIAAFKAIDTSSDNNKQREEAFAARDTANGARESFRKVWALLLEAIKLAKEAAGTK